MTTLSQDSVQRLADSIAPQVFEYLSTNDAYIESVCNGIEPAIVEVVGKVSPVLAARLGVAIMEKIGVPESDQPYAQNNIWKTRYEVLYRYVKETYAESYVDGAEYGIMIPDDIYGY